MVICALAEMPIVAKAPQQQRLLLADGAAGHEPTALFPALPAALENGLSEVQS